MLPGMFLVNMVRKKRIKPEQDAKEHILLGKDKAFIEGPQINTFKGKLCITRHFDCVQTAGKSDFIFFSLPQIRSSQADCPHC